MTLVEYSGATARPAPLRKRELTRCICSSRIEIGI